MIRSMTGFGRSVVEFEGKYVTVELTTVNHRFLDCSVRIPGSWSTLEPNLREILKRALARGKVNVSIRCERSASDRRQIRLDTEVARQYIEATREMRHLMSTPTEVLSLNTLAQLEGVFCQLEVETALEKVEAMLESVLTEALEQLNKTRLAEGQTLAHDIAERVRMMREALADIEKRIPELSITYEERLRARIADLNADVGLTEDRLAIEVALMADKSAVAEEVVRLKAHFHHVLELLESDTPIGRELNFLAQEIQREVNTLGSKLRNVGVIRDVLRIKSELENLREQAQNIE